MLASISHRYQRQNEKEEAKQVCTKTLFHPCVPSVCTTCTTAMCMMHSAACIEPDHTYKGCPSCTLPYLMPPIIHVVQIATHSYCASISNPDPLLTPPIYCGLQFSVEQARCEKVDRPYPTWPLHFRCLYLVKSTCFTVLSCKL